MRSAIATFLFLIGGLLPVSEAHADVTVIALTGQSTPGTTAGVFGNVVSVPSLNNAGDVALSAESSAGNGVWLFRSGSAGELVALTGQRAAGTDDGIFFGAFGDTARTLALGERGDVAFHATLTGNLNPNLGDETGIWTRRAGQPVALVGQSTKVVSAEFTNGGFSFFDNARFFISSSQVNPTGFGGSNPFGSLRIDDNASTYFLSFVSGGTAGFQQTFLLAGADATDLRTLVRSDTEAPGTVDDFFEPTRELPPPSQSDEVFGFSSPSVNDEGRFAFSAGLFRGANSWKSGVWSNREGAGVQPIAVPGQAAPGFGDGQVFEFVGTNPRPDSTDGRIESPGFNDAGHIAFRALADGPGITRIPQPNIGLDHLPDDEGIWVDRGAGPELVVREGQSAPGASPETVFRTDEFAASAGGAFFVGDTFRRPVVAGDGTVAFSGHLGGNEVTDANDWGLWKGTRSDDLELVVREGDNAPGFSDDVFIQDLPIDFGNGGLPRLRRIPGSTRPPAPTALVAPEPTAAINASGRVAFSATLTGPGFEPELFPADGADRGRGIWAEDLNGDLQLIAYTGGLLDVSGDGTDLRTIELLGFAGSSGNQDGMSSGFNDRGQLAFFATFTDGTSGVFVSNLVAVPEPSSAVLVICGILTAAKGISPRREKTA